MFLFLSTFRKKAFFLHFLQVACTKTRPWSTMNSWPGYGGPSGIMYQPQSHLYAPSPHMYAPPSQVRLSMCVCGSTNKVVHGACGLIPASRACPQVHFNPAGTSHRGQQILSGFPPGSYIVARQPTIPSQLQSQVSSICTR
jgi:hypothetical protein